jgi:predicted Zn-dependent protease
VYFACKKQGEEDENKILKPLKTVFYITEVTVVVMDQQKKFRYNISETYSINQGGQSPIGVHKVMYYDPKILMVVSQKIL